MRRTERTRPRWSAPSPTPTDPACRARECRTANLGRSDGPTDWRPGTTLRGPPSLPPDPPTARPPLSLHPAPELLHVRDLQRGAERCPGRVGAEITQGL